jgi:hypothetical protein
MPATTPPLVGLGVGGDLSEAHIPADFDYFELRSLPDPAGVPAGH